MNQKQILSRLEEIRLNTIHSPAEVFTLGEQLISQGYLRYENDNKYTTMEQIALAAAECAEFELAEICLQRLRERFPGSAKVNLLHGQILESKGEILQAQRFYEQIMAKDDTDFPILKRLIALHLHASGNMSASGITLSKEIGLKMLITYLDACYTDTEGWAEAASIYCSLQQYPQALTALSHLILLAPHNPYYLCQHAEVAFTLGEYSLAYQEFLRVIEMSNGVSSKGGVGRRAALGVKLCIGKLNKGGKVQDPLLEPKKMQEVELLMTQLLLEAKPPAMVSNLEYKTLQKWLETR